MDTLANQLINRLKTECLVIQRYNAYSTDSIYIKLDYGVLNSIRISDHEGKKHLKYRYNLIIGCADNITEDEYIRFFFNEDSLQALVNQILIDRKLKVKKYGMGQYIKFMEKNKLNKSNTEGFWKHAIIVYNNQPGHTEAVYSDTSCSDIGKFSEEDLFGPLPWN